QRICGLLLQDHRLLLARARAGHRLERPGPGHRLAAGRPQPHRVRPRRRRARPARRRFEARAVSTALLSHASRRTLFNIGLRGLTLSSRFLLLFALARWLSPAELGLFGLVSAIVGYGIYLVGLEFYAFATRELIRA